MIEIRHASKLFGASPATFKALDDVSLTIEQGEIFGIIGRSAAGKSTLLRLMNQLERPSSGQVRIDSQDIGSLGGAALRRLRQRFGFVFQNDNLLYSIDVTENVRLPLKVAGRGSRSEQIKRVEEVLALVGIADQGAKFPSALSGGQRQRVGIARALVHQPEFLLCDEATSALDPETTQSILQLLLDIHRRLKITVVLVTHSMSVIRAVADRVAVIDRGRVVELGRLVDVFLKPRHGVTRALLAEIGFEPETKPAGEGRRAGRVISLSYRGAIATEPLLTGLVLESQLNFAIVSASVGRLKNVPFGQFTIELPELTDGDFARFLALCAERGIDHEAL